MDKERHTVPVSAQIMLFNENDEVLLLKRKSTGYADGKYGFIGGHVEKNEEVKKAILREIKEEIGIEIQEEDLKFRNILNRRVNEGTQYMDFVFVAKNWKGNIKNMEPEKCSELIWCKPNELPQNIIDFEKYLLENEGPFLTWGW